MENLYFIQENNEKKNVKNPDRIFRPDPFNRPKNSDPDPHPSLNVSICLHCNTGVHVIAVVRHNLNVNEICQEIIKSIFYTSDGEWKSYNVDFQ